MIKNTSLFILFILLCLTSYSQFTRLTNSDLVLEERRSLEAVWGDFNNDGYPDIYVLNGGGTSTNSFFINNGDETFSKVTSGDIATDEIPLAAVSKVDINNDGHLDLFVTGGNTDNFLYQNNGDGTFTKITTGDIVTNGGTSVSWGDYDQDGDLDAAMSKSSQNAFFENNGNGTFTKVTTSEFATVGSSYSTWIDINNDGFLDIYAINFSGSPHLFINNGDKTFTLDSQSSIVVDVPNSENQTWGDFNNDGYLDLFVGRYPINVPPEGNKLFQNNGDGTFTEIETTLKITDTNEFVEGSNWADYDNDGHLDLYMSTSTSRNRLFKNNGDGSFSEINEGFLNNANTASYSVNWADFNNDGYMDLFSAVADFELDPAETDRNYLLKNNGGSSNWLNVSLRGTENNFFGVGAKITSHSDDLILSKRVISNGFGASDFREHFGLGESFGLDSLVVEWPTGKQQVIKNLLSNKFIEIHEDSVYSIPSAPSNPLANALDDESIMLTWENESDTNEGFLLFISTDSMTFDLVDTLDAATTSRTFENLDEGTKYYFNVLSISKSNFSDNSATSAITKLSAPTEISQSNLTSESVQINWLDNSELEDTYVVELDFSEDFSNPELFNSTAPNILLENLTAETSYFLRVKATNPENASDYSDTFSFQTPVILSNEDLVTENIAFYPNPTKDYLNISNPFRKSLSLSLRGLNGSLILSKEIESYRETVSLDMSKIDAGVYVLTLSSEGVHTTKRIIKK